MTLRIVGRPAPPKLKLTASELTVVVRLISRGRTLADALEAIERQRALLAQFHLPLPPR